MPDSSAPPPEWQDAHDIYEVWRSALPSDMAEGQRRHLESALYPLFQRVFGTPHEVNLSIEADCADGIADAIQQYNEKVVKPLFKRMVQEIVTLSTGLNSLRWALEQEDASDAAGE